MIGPPLRPRSVPAPSLLRPRAHSRTARVLRLEDDPDYSPDDEDDEPPYGEDDDDDEDDDDEDDDEEEEEVWQVQNRSLRRPADIVSTLLDFRY